MQLTATRSIISLFVTKTLSPHLTLGVASRSCFLFSLGDQASSGNV
jgi:hypothetical protein